MPLALSPDGKWALVQRWEGPLQAFFLLPTGRGSERSLSIEGLEDVLVARWFPDGNRIALQARDRAESGLRFYVLDLNGGRPRPVSPYGMRLPWLEVSPDGEMLAGIDREGQLMLFPLDGGPPRAVPGLEKVLSPVGWSRRGDLLMIPRGVARPVLSRVDVRTGKMDPIVTLQPTDPVGVTTVLRVTMTPDERAVVFSYPRVTGYLNLVDSPRAP